MAGNGYYGDLTSLNTVIHVVYMSITNTAAIIEPDMFINMSCNYLGASINGGRELTFHIESVKRSFYAAFNSIASKSRSLSELIQLKLIEIYCLPLLTYALPAITYSCRHFKELNGCWNTVY
jgi:hypothetical protein